MTNELQEIREALESGYKEWGSGSSYEYALAALSRLEARAGELPDMEKVIDSIWLPTASIDEMEAAIGQYAYRYSEDIRKERDEWKALAESHMKAMEKLLKK